MSSVTDTSQCADAGRHRVLLIEDDPSFARSFLQAAGRCYDMKWCPSAEEALDQLPTGLFDIVLLDLELQPGRMDGFEFLEAVGQRRPLVPIVLLTRERDADKIIAALARGAQGYAPKQLPWPEILERIDACLERHSLGHRLRDMTHALREERPVVFLPHPAMDNLKEEIGRAARVDTTVLLQGESGSGKTVLAREIHLLSKRHLGPYRVIDCSAIAPSLIDVEVFGSVAGAFTGATNREGMVESAHRGTLFIDELDKFEIASQARLLRLVEEREARRVGSTQSTRLDVRIIAASSRDLRKEADAGRFLSELLNRLEVFRIQIPPLRSIAEVIPDLAQFYIQKLCRDMHRPILGLSPEAARCLTRYAWPGNIRQLRNALESAISRCEGSELLPVHLPPELRPPATAAGSGPREEARHAADEVWRRWILETLRKNGGGIVKTARDLGISKQGLAQKMKRLGLKGSRGN